jgi:predicted  nucleic acid-binding Zn-ribbon protein
MSDALERPEFYCTQCGLYQEQADDAYSSLERAADVLADQARDLEAKLAAAERECAALRARHEALVEAIRKAKELERIGYWESALEGISKAYRALDGKEE